MSASRLGNGADVGQRIWNADSPETLLHPCQTVWAVTQSDDGDIATAGSDGYIRVWSKHPDRQASAEIRDVSPIVLSSRRMALTV